MGTQRPKTNKELHSEKELIRYPKIMNLALHLKFLLFCVCVSTRLLITNLYQQDFSKIIYKKNFLSSALEK